MKKIFFLRNQKISDSKFPLDPFSKLGVLITVFENGERDYLRTILDTQLFQRANGRVHEAGRTLAGDSIERAEEILATLKRHLAEIKRSES